MKSDSADGISMLHWTPQRAIRIVGITSREFAADQPRERNSVASPIPAEAPVTTTTFSCLFCSLLGVYRIVDSGILSIVGWDTSEKGSEKKCRNQGEWFGQTKCHRAGGIAAVYPVRLSQDFHRSYCPFGTGRQPHGIAS